MRKLPYAYCGPSAFSIRLSAKGDAMFNISEFRNRGKRGGRKRGRKH